MEYHVLDVSHNHRYDKGKGGVCLDELFMKEALKLAKEAFDDGEVPVGCVVVQEGEMFGRGRNRRDGVKNARAHAER